MYPNQSPSMVPEAGVSHSLRLAQGAALEPHWGSIHYCPRFDPRNDQYQKQRPPKGGSCFCVCLNETIRALAFTRLYTILFYVQLLCTSIYHHIRPFYTFIHDLALPLKCIRLSQAKETYCFEWRSIVFKPCEGW